MALLGGNDNNRPITLAASCLVGRSTACNVRLSDRRISGEHARISWRDGRWMLRDLGSRNGTFVNGKQIESGSTVALAQGDTIGLGHQAADFSLIDASPPVALARRLDTGEVLLAQDGMLVFTRNAAPAACVVEGNDGRWTIERDGETRPVEDGDVLTVEGLIYMLHLPMESEPTLEERRGKPRIADIALCFRISQDEERVEVLVKHGDSGRLLPTRAHYYTFVTLARARLRDAERPDLPEAGRGWISVEELCRMLAMDEDRLNVDIYRIRRDMSELGLHNPATIIERQRRQLRLGTSRIELIRLA